MKERIMIHDFMEFKHHMHMYNTVDTYMVKHLRGKTFMGKLVVASSLVIIIARRHI